MHKPAGQVFVFLFHAPFSTAMVRPPKTLLKGSLRAREAHKPFVCRGLPAGSSNEFDFPLFQEAHVGEAAGPCWEGSSASALCAARLLTARRCGWPLRLPVAARDRRCCGPVLLPSRTFFLAHKGLQEPGEAGKSSPQATHSNPGRVRPAATCLAAKSSRHPSGRRPRARGQLQRLDQSSSAAGRDQSTRRWWLPGFTAHLGSSLFVSMGLAGRTVRGATGEEFTLVRCEGCDKWGSRRARRGNSQQTWTQLQPQHQTVAGLQFGAENILPTAAPH